MAISLFSLAPSAFMIAFEINESHNKRNKQNTYALKFRCQYPFHCRDTGVLIASDGS